MSIPWILRDLSLFYLPGAPERFSTLRTGWFSKCWTSLDSEDEKRTVLNKAGLAKAERASNAVLATSGEDMIYWNVCNKRSEKTNPLQTQCGGVCTSALYRELLLCDDVVIAGVGFGFCDIPKMFPWTMAHLSIRELDVTFNIANLQLSFWIFFKLHYVDIDILSVSKKVQWQFNNLF